MNFKLFSSVLVSIVLFSCQHPAENSVGNLFSEPASTLQSSDSKKIKYNRPKEILSKESKLNIPYRSLNTSKTITSFGFGSCVNQNQEQSLWKIVQAKAPQIFIMMGDNVYASKAEDKPIIDQYIKLNSNSDYLKARESIPFLATWDDHDFGQNDGGFDNPEKLEARRVFLKYWSYLNNILPKDQDAIYHSRLIGEKKQQVQFIMMDTRFDRFPVVLTESLPTFAATATVSASADNTLVKASLKTSHKFSENLDPKAQILSDAQWKWLDNELKKPAELRILISSIQFLANDHGYEKWGLFPNERKKLLNLLEKNKIKNLIILSGDRHLASIAKLKTKNGDLFDITSSSINKPSKATEPEIDQLYTAPSYLNINFGFAEIDWSKKQIEFQIIGEDAQSHLNQVIKF